jgi:glycerol-3-phosphate acyltransferase PlsY
VASFPVLVYVMRAYGDVPLALAFMIATSLLIVFKHRANIQRLVAGTENRVGAKHA